MKKILRQIICILLICCSFGLSGCLGMSSSGGNGGLEPPSDDILNTAGNAESIINTKDNVTYYYDSLEALQADIGKDGTDRNSLKNTFGDAYVFIDPGSDYIITDHYLVQDGKTTDSDIQYQFYRLVGRQVDLLAEILYTAINRIYFDGTIAGVANASSAKYNFGNSEDGSYNTQLIENHSSEPLDVLIGETPQDYASYIDVSNIYSYMVFSGLESVPEWEIDITTGIDENGNDVEIQQQLLNLSYAVYGGFDILEDGVYDDDIDEDEVNNKYFARYYTLQDVLDEGNSFGNSGITNDANKWNVVGSTLDNLLSVTLIQNRIKDCLKSYIASALSGIDAIIPQDTAIATNYGEMLKAIDHLGFTATDKLNIKNQILDNIIGTEVVKKDDEYLAMLKGDGGIVGVNSKILVSNIHQIFYDEGVELSANADLFEALNYKGYRIVIDAIVEQAMNATISIGEEETLFPELPRVRIIKMNSWDLMDSEETGKEDEDVDIDNVNPDDIQTEPEAIQFEEKFGEFYKIVAILLMPKQVYGERTMAIKENGEWVKDEDGNVKLKTFNVEGFILTGSDLVLLSEEDKMTTYKVDYEVRTATKDIKVSSDISEAGYVKPDPMEEATYNSTTTLDIDKQQILEREESEISDYRIQGYDGFSIVSIDSNLVENTPGDAILVKGEDGQEIAGLKITKKKDGSSVIDITTEMYKYLGISDVNGDAGTTFAGYIIDVSKFAGNNYVVANFPILAVNDNDQDRDSKFNILYFFTDCT